MNNIRKIDYGIKKIEEYFSGFLADGFHLTKSMTDKKGFGNWIVVLESQQCVIKFIEDRGSVSALIGPAWASKEPFDLEHFFDVYLLADFINKKDYVVLPPKHDEYDIDKKLNNLSTVLKENFHNLVLVLNSEDILKVKKDVEEYNLQILRRIYPNIR